MRGKYNKQFCIVLGFAVALAAGLQMPSAQAGSERPLFIALGASVRAPVGWVEFCVEHTRDCDVRTLEARDVVMTTKAWKDLQRINKWVNDSVKPMTDLEHWG